VYTVCSGAEVPKKHKTFATIREVSVPHVRQIEWRNYVKTEVNEMNIWM
jgi:hypothetical protein